MDRTEAHVARSGRTSRLPLLAGVAVAVVHATLLAVVAAHHEPWFDEAQAWLIARDASTTEIITRYAGYEGTPVLWHLLLSVPAKAGLPYQSLAVVAAASAVTAAGLVLLRSPFPVPLKALIPFSYWTFFQYGAVARSYSLLAPLLFGIAVLWPSRLRRPVPVFALLGLLANVSAHGFLVAGVLAGVHFLGVARQWRSLDGSRRRTHVTAAAATVIVSLAIVVQVRPPADITFHGAEARSFRSATAAARYAWAMTRGALAGLPLLSALALVLSAAWFARARCLLVWLLPSVAVLGLSTFQYGNVWHQGILMLLWLFAFWVSLHQAPDGRNALWLRNAALAALASVLLVQISWTVSSARYDLRQPYAGGAAAASAIKAMGGDGEPVGAIGFSTMAIQPYFESNIFANYDVGDGAAFWFWSTKRRMTEPDLGQRPAATIVVQDKAARRPFPHPPPEIPGYRLVDHVRGAIYFKTRVLEQEGYYLFRRNAPQ